MKLSGLFLTLCCGVVILASCNKSDNDDNNNNNNNTTTAKQQLEAGKWQVSAGTSTTKYMGRDTTIDTYIQMDACDKDDFIQFATNGVGTVDENANKCAGDQQIETFTWALLSNDTKMAIIDSNPDTFDVEISSTQLKLKQTRPNSSGAPVTTTQTYKNIK